MSRIDWTQVIVTFLSLVGSIASGLLARRSRRYAHQAKKSADVAVEASLRPGHNGHGTE